MKKSSILALLLVLVVLAVGCRTDAPSGPNAISDANSGQTKPESAPSSGESDANNPPESGASSGQGDAAGEPIPQASNKPAAAVAVAFPEGEWSLVLVNAQNPLPQDFAPQTVSIQGYDKRLFDARAALALTALLDAAEQAGNKLYLVSSYRSIQRQQALFQRKTEFYKAKGLPQEQAQQEAAKLVARPGQSEHNLGLAADIVSADWYASHTDLTQEFENTKEFAWLCENAAQYGFVLRYPKEKQGITGVSYEPWHYRYVGQTAAGAIAAQGITLEEYLQQ